MTELDEKYKKMADACEEYHEKLDALRDQVYGYTNSLDIIVPYYSNLFPTDTNRRRYREAMGIHAFCDKITQYCKEFSGDTSVHFSDGINIDDERYIRDLILCIMYFLQNQCRRADYTFLGFNKILKSFLGSVDDEKRYNKESSTFWHMYDMMDEEDKQKVPEQISDAMSRLYEKFDYHYTYRMAYCIRYASRYFLHDHKYDYMSDPLMYVATIDMIQEIQERLDTICKNRRPRVDRR